MNWKTIISQLQEAGLTQTEIASRCGTSQGTIGDLAAGRSTEPRFGLGTALMNLRDSLQQPEPHKEAT